MGVQERDGLVERVALIAGEAAVSTPSARRNPVVVTAGNGRTTGADGARFNLLAEERAVCVTCLEGHIEVEQGGASRLLSAGQQVVYSARGLSAAVAIDPLLVTAWQNGVVIFQATPVRQVVAEVNRYRPGRVILRDEALGRKTFSARLRIDKIDLAIGQIAEVFGAPTTSFPGGIVLLG